MKSLNPPPPSKTVSIDRELLNDVLKILDSFGYEHSDADEPSTEFSARLSEDWFFYTKNKLENVIASK